MFDKDYFFGGVYENFDTFNDYKKWAEELLEKFSFKSFLDVGCGCGNLTKELRKRNIDSFGVDISEFAVKNANVPFIMQADCVKKLPFKDNQFDIVHIYGTFGYIKTDDDLQAAMQETLRVAKQKILFEDVYGHDSANHKDNIDPFRVRIMNKEEWIKKWKELELPLEVDGEFIIINKV